MRVISRGEGVEAASGQVGRFWPSRKRKGYDVYDIIIMCQLRSTRSQEVIRSADAVGLERCTREESNVESEPLSERGFRRLLAQISNLYMGYPNWISLSRSSVRDSFRVHRHVRDARTQRTDPPRNTIRQK